MTLVTYSRNLDILFQTPKNIPVQFPLDRAKLRLQFESILNSQEPILSEGVSKTLLEAYGIPVTKPQPAITVEEAIKIARQIGYPVVLKILSPDITHKTDVGGVGLDLADESMVRSAFELIINSAKKKLPGARVDGVTVQPMIREKDAIEMILGTKKDPVFGTVMMVGLGGTAAELFGDRALGFPPLNERLARRMLESLKVWPLLQGYRNHPPANVDRLVEILIRLSYLVADYPEIKELDVNPLLVYPDDVIALDARVLLDQDVVGKQVQPYSHLALRPYPEEYVTSKKLKDGTELTFRPIKPEDEPMWYDLLRSCSRESIYQRFRYFFHWESHEVATRYCFIDYDREIAIVVELEEGGKRRLLGVGRLIADPDHETVEFAILIADDWQNRGLGSVLTSYCFEIAERWGLKKIMAQTTPDNPRMIAVFKRYGFEIKLDSTGTVVEVVKTLR